MTFSIDDVESGINSAQKFLNSSNNPLTSDQLSQFKSDGFLLPSAYSADQNGLPYSKVQNDKPGQIKRNNITWFVPEFGIVKMYVNPENITYNYKKNISTPERTKGGYTIQYWGEQLTTLTLTGTTGRSGIEGINVLYEIYRAEQYAFDPMALTIAANTASNDVANNLVNGVGGLIGGLFPGNSDLNAAGASGVLGGILGMDSPNNALANKNIPSLAQLAFTVEMYYNGWVFRGYFTDMNIQEKASDFLISYTLNFTVTQRRGYRVNYFPWSVSAKDGPSNYNTPKSFLPNAY